MLEFILLPIVDSVELKRYFVDFLSPSSVDTQNVQKNKVNVQIAYSTAILFSFTPYSGTDSRNSYTGTEARSLIM